jgi:hypothetical protein
MGKETKSINKMTDDEINNDIQLYTNIEFNINNSKFILKNIILESFNGFDKVKIIRLLLQEIDWYQILLYDEFKVLDDIFILTERTKSKVVLVRKNTY